MKKIKIKTEKYEIEAVLNETETAEKIYNSLPIESEVNTWGEEIYFDIPVKTGLEKPVETVKIGDLAYWPPQNCFCIFFGKTPTSTGDEIKPATAVTIVGKITSGLENLKKIKSGEKIYIEKSK